MGISEQLHVIPKYWTLDLNKNSITLVLSEAEMAAANIEGAKENGLPMQLMTLDAGAEIPSEALEKTSILVVEVRPDIPRSLDRFANIGKQSPHIPIVAAVRDADLALVRMLVKQGVKDVVALPLQISEMAGIVNEIAVELEKKRSADVRLGCLTTVLKCSGGAGATTLATQIASSLAGRGYERGVCLIDLDLQFGNAASYLGLSNQLSVGDLIAAGSRMDGQLLKSVASVTPEGLHVIAAPAEITPFETVNMDQIMSLVELARIEYDEVVLDMPTNWTNWTLSLISQSTTNFHIIELTVASLTQAKRQLDLLRGQGLCGENFHIIANRVQKKLFRSIDLGSASQALGHPVRLSVHNDYPLVSAAHDQGVLIQQIRAKSKVLQDVENILSCMDGTDAVETE